MDVLTHNTQRVAARAKVPAFMWSTYFVHKHTVHGGLQMTDGTLPLVDALFQGASICASVDSATRDYVAALGDDASLAIRASAAESALRKRGELNTATEEY